MEAPGLIPSLIGAPLAGAGGRGVGVVEDLLCDEQTNRPLWLLVRLDAGGFTYVPAGRLASRRAAVAVPYDEDSIRAAPVRLPQASRIAREHAVRLCRHYGVRLPSATWMAAVRGVRAVPTASTLAEAS
jgi:hypothetical protein